jgi:hypothetical protein
MDSGAWFFWWIKEKWLKEMTSGAGRLNLQRGVNGLEDQQATASKLTKKASG